MGLRIAQELPAFQDAYSRCSLGLEWWPDLAREVGEKENEVLVSESQGRAGVSVRNLCRNLGSIWNQVVLNLEPWPPRGVGILLGGSRKVDWSRHGPRAPDPLLGNGERLLLCCLGTCRVPLGSLRTVLRGSLILRSPGAG